MLARDKRRGRVRPLGDETVTAQSLRDDRSSLLLEDRITRVFRELPGAVAGQEESDPPGPSGRPAPARGAAAAGAQGRQPRRSSKAVKVLRQLTRSVGAGRDMDVVLGLLQDRLEALAHHERRAAGAPEPAAGGAGAQPQPGRRGHPRPRHRRPAPQPAAPAARGSRGRRRRCSLRARALREEQGAALLRGFSQVGERFEPEALHALRRRARRLRYAAEIEDAVRGDETRAPALWKRLQDAIGVIHDHHVLASWLEEQARAAVARDNALLARAALRERRAFLGHGAAAAPGARRDEARGPRPAGADGDGTRALDPVQPEGTRA